MVRVAFLGYDMSALRTSNALFEYFDNIDYYLINRNQKSLSTDFFQIPVLTDSYCIPAQEKERTNVQKTVADSILRSYKELSAEILGEVLARKSSLNPLENASQNGKIGLFDLSEVKDIFFNEKTLEFNFEKKSASLSSYHFLILEDSPLITDVFLESPRILRQKPEKSHVWLKLEFKYELTKPRDQFYQSSNLFLVHDKDYDSVIDNWYYIQLLSDKICVQQWIPYHQQKNTEFINFISNRTKNKIQERLEFIHLKNLDKQSVNSTAGYTLKKAELVQKKNSAVLPSFHFWTDIEMKTFIEKEVENKVKKIKKNILKKIEIESKNKASQL